MGDGISRVNENYDINIMIMPFTKALTHERCHGFNRVADIHKEVGLG